MICDIVSGAVSGLKGCENMDVLFELIYHISAIGIVVILTIFMLWQFFDNIRTAMDTPDDEE